MTDIVEQVWANDDLRAAVRLVERHSVVRDFEASAPAFLPVVDDEIDYTYLLGAASVLARSDREPMQDAALRIAQSCLDDPDSSELERSAAAYILMRLDNTPALGLAVDRGLLTEDYLDDLPHPLRIDSIRRRLDHMIFLASGEAMHANDFQREFWNSVEKWGS